MLVNLHALPAVRVETACTVRRAFSFEKDLVLDWVDAEFGRAWRSECDIAFARQPVSCVIAIDRDRLLGFGCYDVTARGLFGPMGVAATDRERGIGTALLVASLQAMRDFGYAYVVIGAVADAQPFYEKVAGATAIPNSAARISAPPRLRR